MTDKPARAPEVFNRSDIAVDVDDVLRYLDQLRTSGATNMFGAAPYVEKMFNVNKRDATKLLKYWMTTFGARKRAAKGGAV